MKYKTILAGAAIALGLAGAALAQDKTKVGFIYVGPVGDGGWNYEHNQGRLAVEKHFGDAVETVFQESVPEGADAERAMTQMALSGADLIFTTSFGYMDPTINVAAKFPNVKFEHATGFKRADNVSTYSARFYEGRAVQGLIAGSMTKTNKIGYIASFPIPEVIRGINAAYIHAKKANPDIKVLYTWTGSFEDPIKAKQASESMIEQGADVLTGNLNAGWFGVFKAAKEAGNIPCVTEWVDNRDLAPEVVVSSILKDQARFVVDFARGSKNGTFPAEFRADKLTPEMGPAILKTDRIPSDVYDAAMKIQDQLMKGEITVNVGDCR